MCLSRFGKFKLNKYGYKVFRKTVLANGKVNYYSCIEHKDYGKPYLINKWYTAIVTDLRTWDADFGDAGDGETYDSGFHIYNSVDEAKHSRYYLGRLWGDDELDRVVCKVEYKNFITGYGDGTHQGKNYKQIVAQKMRIVGEIK